MCMENHAFWIFGALVWLGEISSLAVFANNQPMHQKFQKHDFPCTFAPLLNHFRSEKIWSKLGQVWSKFDQFFDSIFLSFHLEMGFGKKHWIPKFQLFRPNGSKVIPLHAFKRMKANFSVTLQPLRLKIGEEMPKPIKFGPK